MNLRTPSQYAQTIQISYCIHTLALGEIRSLTPLLFVLRSIEHSVAHALQEHNMRLQLPAERGYALAMWYIAASFAIIQQTYPGVE